MAVHQSGEEASPVVCDISRVGWVGAGAWAAPGASAGAGGRAPRGNRGALDLGSYGRGKSGGRNGGHDERNRDAPEQPRGGRRTARSGTARSEERRVGKEWRSRRSP